MREGDRRRIEDIEYGMKDVQRMEDRGWMEQTAKQKNCQWRLMRCRWPLPGVALPSVLLLNILLCCCTPVLQISPSASAHQFFKYHLLLLHTISSNILICCCTPVLLISSSATAHQFFKYPPLLLHTSSSNIPLYVCTPVLLISSSAAANQFF